MIKSPKALLVALLCLILTPNLMAEYILEKGDAIRMTVFLEPDLAKDAKIDKAGDVSFPLIGSVTMEGLSLKAAELKLKELYEKDFLQNAQVNVTVLSHSQKWVTVGGDVTRPGTIQYPQAGSLDLRGAIAQAGGVRESADNANIIVRRESGAVKRYSLSKSGSLVLKHGDTVTVGRSSISSSSITVTGKVGRPGVVVFPKKGGMDIMTALAQAGGFSRIANTKVVTVRRNKQIFSVNIRNIESGKEKLFYMKAGDILHVKESRL